MSNPFAETDEDNSGEIIEGFLCPICREDLKSFAVLTEHFERSHAEEQDALKSVFKDIFSKAKRKIRLNFDDSLDVSRNLEKNSSVSGSNRINLQNTTNEASKPVSNARTRTNVFNFMDRQDVGQERNHFNYFRSVRDPRLERYAAETNKLIIRLHKLLVDMPTDPTHRKQHEQSTVPWLDGSSVKLCPSCAKSFHIARRQHHCRLCGSIMCNDCSKFLSFDTALQLASLSMSHSERVKQLQASAVQSPQQSGIRICGHCLWLLETRQSMHDSRTCFPSVSQLYAEIQESRKLVMPDVDMYLKIVGSLYEGESIFTIADAGALRRKIGHIAESIDLRSKRIIGLPCEHGSREEALNKAIRLSSIQLIKENMLSLPPLPAEEEIRGIQDRKRKETEQRIETERRRAMEAFERCGLGIENESSKYTNSDGKPVHGSDLRSLDNWSAHQVTVATNFQNDDPLVEQINIIKGYIKQARQEMNFDVVETLQKNLRELQAEYYERHKTLAKSHSDANPPHDTPKN